MNSDIAVSSESSTRRVIVICVYFGKWPPWFPAFLLSCAKNTAISWLFFTDCPIPNTQFENVRFAQIDLQRLHQRASQKLGFQVEKDFYGLCDLRSIYGVLFEEYLAGFDFWGHCDLDVIWGDILEFLPDSILDNYEIISTRKQALAGHLTFWRNTPEMRSLFCQVPQYETLLRNRKNVGLDEALMSEFLATTRRARVYWEEKLVVGWRELEVEPFGWHWEKGRLFDKHGQEHIYMHFMRWKNSLGQIDFQVGEQPDRFKITPWGIYARRVPFRINLFQHLPIKRLKRIYPRLDSRMAKAIR